MKQIGIVSMMRNPGNALHTFIKYHSNIGFTHFYILFDDPSDPDIALATEYPNVTAIPVTDEVKASWKDLHYYHECAEFTDTTVGARQVLNIEYGINRALKDGMDWLLHIDIDELIRVRGNDIHHHVEQLENSNIECASYLNFEGIPSEMDNIDYFHTTKLFKKPIKLLQHQQISRSSVWPRTRQYFNFYTNGKSMAKVKKGIVPLGAHRWAHLDENLKRVVFFNPSILHYAVCGYTHFKQKYLHRGNFSNFRMKKDLHKNGARLDLDARDAFMQGNENLAKEIYKSRVMMDSELQNKLLEHHILQKFELTKLMGGLPTE